MILRKYKKVLFIDGENVGNDIPDKIEKDTLYYYFTNNTAKWSIESVLKIKKYKNIKIFDTSNFVPGKNALDFCIIVELTEFIKKYKNKMEYYIISKDSGYDAAIKMLKTKAYIKRHISINQVNSIAAGEKCYRYHEKHNPEIIQQLNLFIDKDMLKTSSSRKDFIEKVGEPLYTQMTIIKQHKNTSLTYDVFGDKTPYICTHDGKSKRLTTYSTALEYYNHCLSTYKSAKLADA